MWGSILQGLKFVLNPANWMRILSVVEGILTILKAIQERIEKRRQEKKNEEIKKDEAIASDATKSDEERVEALCRIEKSIDPDSDCDSPKRDDELPKGSSGT